MPEIAKRSVKQLLKHHAPGDYNAEAITKTQEILDDFIRELAQQSKEIAQLQNKNKRITEKEIKIASKFILKQ